MLEVIKSQTQNLGFHHSSQQACEVNQFMQNFYEAVRENNAEEISTYYSDEMESFDFPLKADWRDETIVVDDHLATFSCTLRTSDNGEQKLKCVLDKSEGYWQIIFGEIKNSNSSH